MHHIRAESWRGASDAEPATWTHAGEATGDVYSALGEDPRAFRHLRALAPNKTLPIPSPPDRDARLAQLYSYRAGSCNASGTTPGQAAVPTVSGPDAQFAFGVIARGEAPYLEEWVLYHLFIGVDIIYLYDNEDVPTYHRLFECNPRVKVIHFPNVAADKGIQLLAQEHWVKTYKDLHTWAMLPNADEFIVLKKFYDIKDFARNYLSPTVPGVALPWLFFGHSNHVYMEDVPLSVRFTQRAPRLVCSKTMFLCSQVYAHPHAHYPRYRRFETRSKEQYIAIGTDPAKNKLPIYERHQARIRPQHLLPVELSEAMVFHFFNKSLEEHVGRREFRHRPDVPLTSVHTNDNATRAAKMREHRLNETVTIINDRWRRYIGYQGDDMVEDRSLHDYWMANLQDLYTRMRVFSYDDPWPLPLRVPSEQHVSQDEVSAFAVVAHEEWMRADALAAAAEEEEQEAAAAAASGSVDSPGSGASYSPQY